MNLFIQSAFLAIPNANFDNVSVSLKSVSEIEDDNISVYASEKNEDSNWKEILKNSQNLEVKFHKGKAAEMLVNNQIENLTQQIYKNFSKVNKNTYQSFKKQSTHKNLIGNNHEDGKVDEEVQSLNKLLNVYNKRNSFLSTQLDTSEDF